MRKTGTILMTVLVAVFFAACGGAADNKTANSNTNANAAKPVAAAPTADALLAMDKAANEAWIKGDTKHFEGMLNDKFVAYEGGTRMGRADMIKMVGGNKCEVKEGWKLEDPQMAKINDDTYVMTYKTTMDGTCNGPDGKALKIPSPTRAASVWVRNGDKWQGVFHGENLIIDPKAPPPPPAKAEAKKEEPKKDDKAASNSNTTADAAPAKPTPSANTDALVKIHTSGWEAFKAKDAKKFDEIIAANVVNVDPIGTVVSGKANVIKQWTETMKCEGITKVAVSDGFSTAISPTVELFTLKGTADGTCDGQKNGDMYQSTIYVKEGDAWKLAFMFEALAM